MRREDIFLKKTTLVFDARFLDNVKDVIGGALGSVTGGTPSYSSNGLHFRGNNVFGSGIQYIVWSASTNRVPAPSTTQSLTFLCDFMSDFLNSDQKTILHFGNDDANRINLEITSSGMFTVKKYNNGTSYYAPTQFSISTNSLYTNMGFTWDADTGYLSLIANGQIINYMILSNFTQTQPDIKIGFDVYGSSCFFRGYIRNARFYDGPFSSDMLI